MIEYLLFFGLLGLVVWCWKSDNKQEMDKRNRLERIEKMLLERR